MIIFTSRESKVGSNKVHNQNTWSWICGFGGNQITSRVCAFCEEGHVTMDCPIVPFHIRASITRHVELQNVARILMD
jgi:hypothetical protein